MSKRKLPDVSNVGVSQTFTIRVPVGPTYDRIMLEVGGATNYADTQFTALRVLLNGKVIQEFADLGKLDAINTYHGRVAASGSGTVASPKNFSIHFRRPELQAMGNNGKGQSAFSTVGAERLTALRTGDLQTVTIEGTIGAIITVPFVRAYGIQADGPPEPLGFIVKIKRNTYNPAGSGDLEISDWSRGPRYLAVHFDKSDVTAITHKVNGFAVIDSMPKTVLQREQSEEGRVPVSGLTVLDFAVNGDMDGALVTDGVQDMRTTLTLGSGGSLPAYIEMVSTLDGPG